MPHSRRSSCADHVVAEGEFSPSFDWSPDGSLITFAEQTDYGRGRIWIAPADGSPALIVDRATLDAGGYNGWGPPFWSPDGSQVAFSERPNRAFVTDADGASDPQHVDDLTYASWASGSFCDICLSDITNEPITNSAPGA
jgi:Tol biopolymer transport system component